MIRDWLESEGRHRCLEIDGPPSDGPNADTQQLVAGGDADMLDDHFRRHEEVFHVIGDVVRQFALIHLGPLELDLHRFNQFTRIISTWFAPPPC
jgi:hypothetical protein